MAAVEQVTPSQGKVSQFLSEAMNSLMPLWDRLLIVEPERWIVAVVLVASGQAAVHSSNQEELFWHISYSLGTFWHYLSVCMLLAAGGLKRQISRIGMSADPGPGNRLGGESSSSRIYDLAVWGLLALGLLGMALLGPMAVVYGAALFFISGGIEGITAGRANPVKPLRMLQYAGMALLLLLLGWEQAEGSFAAVWSMLAPYAAGSLAVIILLVMEPFEPVGEASVVEGSSTYGWILLMIATALVILAVVAGLSNGDPVISTAGAIALPFYLTAVIYRRPADLSRGIRYSIIILIIFAGARYPVIYLPILALYYIARFYFGRRYHLGFPAFAPESAP